MPVDLSSISPLLILTNQLCVGGAEVYVVTVSRWLAERGVEVAVAATPGDLVGRLSPGVDYYPVPLSDIRWTLPMAVGRVRRIAKRTKPKAIIANSLATAWIGRMATLRSRTPVLEVAHGWPVDRYSTVAKLMRVNDLVVPVSVEVEGRLRAGGLPDRLMRVVPNGVDLSPFTTRPDEERDRVRREVFGASSGDIVVTSTGRYTDQKAQHHLVEAAARLKPTHPHLRFGIIGYGEREAELRSLIEQRDVSDMVRLLLKRSDVPDLLMASDIYINCSNWEGMPLSTIEAMGAALPLVCTRTEGIGALIPDDSNGIIAEVGDVAGMAEALARLADDAALRNTMGEAAKRMADENFGMDRMCAELAGVIGDVAA